MGLLDLVEQVAGGSDKADHARVAGGLIEEMQQHPGGLGSLLQSFQQNGRAGMVQQWTNGQTQQAQPADMEAGLAGTGLIDKIAQRTGLSATVVKTGLAVALPILVHHMTSNNQSISAQQPSAVQQDSPSLLKAVLSRMM